MRSDQQQTIRKASGKKFNLYAAGIALLVTAVLALGCFLVDIIEGQIDHLSFGVVALSAGLTGAACYRFGGVTGRPTSSQVLTAFVIGLTTLVAVSTLVYLFEPATDGLLNALFESVAGFTTTASTTMSGDDFADTGRAVLLWRSMTQWIGGAVAVTMFSVIVPFWGTVERDASPDDHTNFLSLAPTTDRGLERALQVYVTLSVVFAVAFFAAGLPWFDALTHAASTVSTGGFATSDLSVLQWDSVLVEWITTAAMTLTGLSVAALWWVLRGRPHRLASSVEVRVYLAVVLLGGGWFALAEGSAGGASVHDAIRRGLFTSTSMLSTTGHRVADWTLWDDGAQTAGLVLIGIGSMSGAIGAGFRWRRALLAFSYGRQALRVQLRPNAIAPVKVGDRVVNNELVNRMTAQQSLACVLGLAGIVWLAASGMSLKGAVGATVSALSTFGPGLGEFGAFDSAGVALGAWTRLGLIPLMIAGRLSLYPVFVASANLWSFLRRQVR